MEVQYKKDLYASYMLIHIPGWIDRSQYTFKMLERNHIPGILSEKERIEDGKALLYVDITGKKNLIQEYVDRKMELEEMTTFFQQLTPVFEELKKYLLTEKMVLLEPEFIYKDMEDHSLWLTILPWERQESSLHKLAEFFLEKINHRDEHGVNAAYHFYRQQSQPQFSLYQFLPVLEKENILKRQKQKEKTASKYPSERAERNSCSYEEGTYMSEKESVSIRDIENSDLSEYIENTENSALDKEKTKNKTKFWNKIFGRFFSSSKKRNSSKAESDSKYYEINSKREQEGYPYSYEETVFFESKDSEDILKLQWKEKGRVKQFTLENCPVTAGKMQGEVSLLINHPSISRIHCRFVQHNGGIALMDMNSTNGTFLNGMKLKQGEILEIVKNDEILIGKVKVLVV